jgi:redox-sensitive bicupin YhaK (pirin superfamily)
LEEVPKIKTDTYEIRVYSGSSNGLTSPLKNHTPFTLVDFRLMSGAVVTQEIPSHYNGLVYVLKGSVKAGDKIIKAEQAGWLDKTADLSTNSRLNKGNTEIQFEALENDTHFVLYAGQPHNVPVVHHGPFVADTMEDIAQMYRDFRQGKFPHLNDLPDEQKVTSFSETSKSIIH